MGGACDCEDSGSDSDSLTPRGLRVGAALLSLRRWDEARAAYDAGLQVDPGSDELRRGHAEAMRAIGTSAGGSAAAAAAKARGNDAFGAADFTRAAQLYTEAIAAAPADASLYSNRSAAHVFFACVSTRTPSVRCGEKAQSKAS